MDIDKNFNVKSAIKKLLYTWIEKENELQEIDKKVLFDIGCKYQGNTEFLYEINKFIIKKTDNIKNSDKSIIVKNSNEIIELNFKETIIEFDSLELRRILIGMIDLLEIIHPLGTVVELKKKYLSKHIKVDSIEKILIVITNRFLNNGVDKSYFPYAGVAYPIGTFDENEVIHFTPSLIENVVHMGYSNIQDEVYTYLMKKELIIDNGMHSYGFSTETELKSLERLAK